MAAALLLFARAGWQNQKEIGWYCQGISLRYAEPLAPGAAAAAQQKNPGLTFWCQQKTVLSAGNTTVEVAGLFYLGDAVLVWGQPCIKGAMPGPLECRGCALSTAAADSLFGSENVVGLELVCEDTSYVVCGVFESSVPMALLPNAGASFTAVELPATEQARQNPDTWAAAVLRATGLPEPDWRLCPFEWQGLAQFVIWLPFCFAALLLVRATFQAAVRRSAVCRDILLFFVLLTLVIALPVLLQSLPQWLIPTRWSDFAWWKQTFTQLTIHLLAWLRVPPANRDVCVKTCLLLQLGMAAIQGALCEMLRCSLTQPPANGANLELLGNAAQEQPD